MNEIGFKLEVVIRGAAMNIVCHDHGDKDPQRAMPTGAVGMPPSGR